MTSTVADRIARLSPEQRAVLEKRLLDARQAAAPAPAPRDPHTPIAAASPQARLWLIQQLDPGMILFNAPGVWHVQGALNPGAVQFALDTIVARHTALRTGLQVVNGQPVQVVHPPRAVELQHYDLEGVDAEQREAELHRIIRALIQRSFDLARDVLLRAAVIRIRSEEFYLTTSRHHIANDAWSVGIFNREFAECYRAFVAGESPQLPTLRADYADFAAWQNERMQGAWFEQEMDYWRAQLRDVPNLDLPTDHPRPPRLTYRGAQLTMRLEAELTDRLGELAQRENVTLFMLMLAAFDILLGRYAGQDDFAVGTNILGRDRVEYENLIGYFANVLALRTNLSGNPTFREFLQRTRQTVRDSFAHSQVPFEKLIWDLRRTRDESRTPLFQVLFQVTQMDFRMSGLPGVRATPEFFDPQTSEYDLSLDVRELPNGLQCGFRYSSDLFDRTTIERLAGHFQVLLREIVRQPDTRIDALQFLSEGERTQLLVEGNRTQARFAREQCLHYLVAAQAARTPDALAVVFENQSLTYRELDARANCLAQYLQRHGVTPDTRVGICIERSLNLLVAVLGVLKAGGAYLPLEPNTPPARLRFMLNEANAKLLITSWQITTSSERALDEMAGGIPRILIDADWELIAQAPGAPETETLPTRVTPEHLAYVIYTSGTTGQPKGVMIEHHSLVNHATFCQRYYELTAQDRVLQFTPLAFDFAAEEIFPAWLSGACVVLRPERAALAPTEFLEFVTRHRLTVLELPTAFWHTLVQAMDEFDLALPACVRLVAVGGEKVDAPAFAKWRARVGTAVRWVNTYGPTETTIIVATFEPGAHETNPADIPIGRPIANTQLLILDSQLDLVPRGVTGELYVGGEPVGRGYIHQPALTAQKFIPHPHAGGARLYRTGDRARYRADGQIEFKGRRDAQVKLRGFRIELGEIQAALAAHPLVQQCAVVLHETPGNKRLVAYVAARKESLGAHELRAWLSARLPEYMLPGAFIFLASLPLTPFGKVDRAALPLPPDASVVSTSPVAARDELESALVSIWQRLLKVEPLSVTDNFFEVGGHSLAAIALFSEIKRTLDKELPVATLFQAPTIEQLARVLREPAARGEWNPLVAIQAHGARPPFICVHGFGGGVIGYTQLARLLGPEQPFWGLQARGQSEQDEPDATIEAMAARYVEAIQAHQPHGPYYLGGYCYGGTVAFEIAHQLRARGETVAFLGIFEDPAPKSGYRRFRLTPATTRGFVKNLPNWTQDYFQLDWSQKWRRVERELKQRTYQRRMLRAPREENIPPVDLRDVLDDVAPIPLKHQKLIQIHIAAMVRYQPKPYRGRVTVFRTRRQPLFCSHDPFLGWKELASDVEVRLVEGSHHNLLEEPYVESLARELAGCLRLAQGSVGT